MSLHFKSEVRFHPVLAMAVAMRVVEEVFDEFGYPAWISSGNDGEHKPGSFHYKDAALDFRIRHVPEAKRTAIVKALYARLWPQFDVLWEDRGKANEHLHVEYDPK